MTDEITTRSGIKSPRSESEVRAILDQLQLIADDPQLRHRLGRGRVMTRAPFADSRRPNGDGLMDYGVYPRDQQHNYATGLL